MDLNTLVKKTHESQAPKANSSFLKERDLESRINMTDSSVSSFEANDITSISYDDSNTLNFNFSPSDSSTDKTTSIDVQITVEANDITSISYDDSNTLNLNFSPSDSSTEKTTSIDVLTTVEANDMTSISYDDSNTFNLNFPPSDSSTDKTTSIDVQTTESMFSKENYLSTMKELSKNEIKTSTTYPTSESDYDTESNTGNKNINVGTSTPESFNHISRNYFNSSTTTNIVETLPPNFPKSEKLPTGTNNKDYLTYQGDMVHDEKSDIPIPVLILIIVFSCLIILIVAGAIYRKVSKQPKKEDLYGPMAPVNYADENIIMSDIQSYSAVRNSIASFPDSNSENDEISPVIFHKSEEETNDGKSRTPLWYKSNVKENCDKFDC